MRATFTFLFIFFLLNNVHFSFAEDPYRLSHKVEPVFQFIYLNLDPDNDSYTGSTKIVLEIANQVSDFRLHGKDFDILSLSIFRDSKSIKTTYNFQEFGLLKILPDEVLTPGKYTMEVEFKGFFSKKGEGIVKFTKDSVNYIYTQMQDIYARQFFPCFDEPNFKFPYQITITAPQDYLIVSNTTEEKVTEENDLKTILFKKTKPIPSYLLAFAVGPYEVTPIPDLSVPGRIILPKGYMDKSRYGKKITAKILMSLEAYFGLPYPYEKLDFIGVDNYNFGAMENPGLVVYSDTYLIDSDVLSLSSKYYIANIIAHELAHMWFGNLVTMNWWNDTWLNEGFATWVADEIVLEEFPELNSMDEIYRNFSLSARSDHSESITPIVREIKGEDKPLESFDALSYSKSQVVLRMLETWMGRDNFRLGLQSYFKKFQWSNTVSDDLFTSMTSVTDLPVKQMMHDFIMQAGIPVVSVQIEGNKITLSQDRLKTVDIQQNFDTKWMIPLNLKIFDGKRVHQKQIILDQTENEFVFSDLDTIEWLHLKNNVTGYYLTLLPTEIMNAALNSGQLTKTEIQDIFIGWQYGWQAGKVNPVDILKTAYRFRNNQNKSFIGGFAGRIENIKHIFSLTIPPNTFNPYMEKTALPMLDNYGIEMDLSFTRSERRSQEAIINSLENIPLIVNKISNLGREYFINHSLSHNYSLYMRTLFYHEGDEELYTSVRKRIVTSKNPSEKNALISTLGFFPDNFTQKNLDFALTGDLQPNDRLWIPLSTHFRQKDDKRNDIMITSPHILEWIKEHENFYHKTVSEDVFNLVLPIFVYDREDLNTFNRLFKEESRPKIVEIELQKQISKIKRFEKLNQLYAEDVLQYLKEFNNSTSSADDH